jgi:hypothetical protein
LFSECRRACDSASTRPSGCGQRPCRNFCSQIRRQSVRHSPWHLNSLPGPPILPPHPGHTQFRMPDITSPLSGTVIQFIFIDCISTSRKKSFRASRLRRRPVPGTPLAPAGCQRSHPLWTECISCSKQEEPAVAFKDLMSNYIYATEFFPVASERYGNVPRAAVAFAVPPTPVSSFRCKGGSCSAASPRQTTLFIILDDFCLARLLKQPTEKPRPAVSLRFGLRDPLKVPTSRYADSRVRRRIRPLIRSTITGVVYFAENAPLS